MFNFFKSSENVRNFVFGVEDSLVSTVGFISGIVSAGLPRREILVSGFILILVEGFSMGVGALISENSVAEVSEHKELPYAASRAWAFIMFLSYIVAGAFVIAPYGLLPVSSAFWVSVTVALILLFGVGAIIGHYAKISLIKKGLSVALIGGLAIIIGVAVGSFLNV
ncbi:MAG: VIT1/CCC1 transporter family protein [Candidatus Campbellbacteria bacterium]|nr:VIT1/CCC1 transporter family protein [Candidatus Campbellbacteria bacterium]